MSFVHPVPLAYIFGITKSSWSNNVKIKHHNISCIKYIRNIEQKLILTRHVYANLNIFGG